MYSATTVFLAEYLLCVLVVYGISVCLVVPIKTLQFMQSRWKVVVVDVLAVFPPTISDTFYCTKYIIQIPVNP